MSDEVDNELVLHVAPRFRLLVHRDDQERTTGEGLSCADGFDNIMSTARRVKGGRSTHRILESKGDPIRLRPSRHGGLLARLLGDRFLSPDRPFREFRLLRTLKERGVSLPSPAFAIGRRRGLFWRSALACFDRANALDGAAWFATHPDDARLRRACTEFGRMLRKLHDAGGLHGDLHLGNVLIEEPTDGHEKDSLRLILIDLDRARIVTQVSDRQRFRELMRFVRSLEKTDHADRVSASHRALALSAYCASDRKLRRSMLRWRSVEARRIRRHRVGWWLGNRVATVLLVALLGFGLACGSTDRVDPMSDHSPAPEDTRWSLIATGDTGRTSALPRLFEGQLSVAAAMTQEAQRDPVDGLALLGDNFYWHGLDLESLVPRVKTNLVRPYCYFLDLSGPRSTEVEKACPIVAPQRKPVDVFAVLGNHDLDLPDSARLQREVLPDFLPGWRMSDGLAQVHEVGPGVSLILFESEVSINDRVAIKEALTHALSEARGPWRILATHRPIATDDEGNPATGGYPRFVREAIAESGQAVQLVMAGHHHSLQVFEVKAPTPALHIGIGSGSRSAPPLAQNHPDARFGALELGFARVDLVSHGAEERLSVRLFAAPRWPWMGLFRSYALRAHFEVNRQGQVREHALLNR